MGSLKSETVKYGREYQGTRTRERLRWEDPAAYTKDRPVLSSEGAPQKQDRNCQTVIAKYLVMSPRWGSTPRLTDPDWLTDRQSQCDFDFYFDYVTSGGIKCGKGTPIIKKPNPSLFIKGGTTKEEKKQKFWHWTNIWPWVPAGPDARSDRAGWLPAVSYCSALLCFAYQSSPVVVQLPVESQLVKRRLYVCCSYSETVINPLPGYD
jgi:hypothetical protein